MPKQVPIPVFIHGLRNRTARFGHAQAGMYVGSQGESADTDGKRAFLLTVEGVDDVSGEYIDIEIAVAVDQAARLINLLKKYLPNT